MHRACHHHVCHVLSVHNESTVHASINFLLILSSCHSAAAATRLATHEAKIRQLGHPRAGARIDRHEHVQRLEVAVANQAEENVVRATIVDEALLKNIEK